MVKSWGFNYGISGVVGPGERSTILIGYPFPFQSTPIPPIIVVIPYLDNMVGYYKSYMGVSSPRLLQGTMVSPRATSVVLDPELNYFKAYLGRR